MEENYIILRNKDEEIKIEFLKEEKKYIRPFHQVNM